jgi:hypothetical protein
MYLLQRMLWVVLMLAGALVGVGLTRGNSFIVGAGEFVVLLYAECFLICVTWMGVTNGKPPIGLAGLILGCTVLPVFAILVYLQVLALTH